MISKFYICVNKKQNEIRKNKPRFKLAYFLLVAHKKYYINYKIT